MKRGALFGLSLLTLLGACRGNYQQDVVKSTYIHKYGVPVNEKDWVRQGEEGKIVQLRKDGVTATLAYSAGVLDGESTYSFPNSSIVAIAEVYKAGILVGKKTNYTSGVPCSHEEFENDLMSRRSVWYEDGTPQTVESYLNGLLVSGEYRSPSNSIEARVEEGEGIRVERDKDGLLVARESVQGGHRVERVDYYVTGDPKAITPYLHEHVHGTRLTFAPGGLPQTVEQWAYDQQEGITVIYQNGEKVAELPYRHGQREGVEKKFREGSILVEEMTWKNDEPHGRRVIYVDGQEQVDYFHHGAIVTRATFERLNPPHHHA